MAHECGGGAQSLFGQCPNVGSNKLHGSSLKPEIFLPARLHVELTTHHLPAARSPELFADQEPNNLQSLPCPLCGHKSQWTEPRSQSLWENLSAWNSLNNLQVICSPSCGHHFLPKSVDLKWTGKYPPNLISDPRPIVKDQVRSRLGLFPRRAVILTEPFLIASCIYGYILIYMLWMYIYRYKDI